MKESALRFNVIKHNSSDGLGIEQRDWLWSGLQLLLGCSGLC